MHNLPSFQSDFQSCPAGDIRKIYCFFLKAFLSLSVIHLGSVYVWALQNTIIHWYNMSFLSWFIQIFNFAFVAKYMMAILLYFLRYFCWAFPSLSNGHVPQPTPWEMGWVPKVRPCHYSTIGKHRSSWVFLKIFIRADKVKEQNNHLTNRQI